MRESNPIVRDVEHFILEHIDTVPHLEALLLVWNRRPKAWSPPEMGAALYVPDDTAQTVLQDLAQQGFLRQTSTSPTLYEYQSSSEEQDKLIALVEASYRRELVRISRMIHAKLPSGLREFARAFRLTKDKDKE